MPNNLSGYIKLHRSLLDWEWCDDPNTLSLWVHLLVMASFKPSKWHGQQINPGQLWTSIPTLVEITGLTAQCVRTCLERLKSTGEITDQSTVHGRLITVVNWAKFQSLDDLLTDKITDSITDNQQTTNRQVTDNQQHRNNVKNVKKVRTKEENPVTNVTDRTVGEPPTHTQRQRFTPPSMDMVREYCQEREKGVDASMFIDFYTSKGWYVGKNPMRDWKAAVRTWEKRSGEQRTGNIFAEMLAREDADNE